MRSTFFPVLLAEFEGLSHRRSVLSDNFVINPLMPKLQLLKEKASLRTCKVRKDEVCQN